MEHKNWLVESAVARQLDQAATHEISAYRAGCAERWVQVFTGLRALSSQLNEEVDYAVDLVSELWKPSSDQITRHAVDEMEKFPELILQDPPRPGISDTFRLFSLLAIRYAAESALGYPEANIKCGHISLTAAGTIGGSRPGKIWYARELEFQRNAFSIENVGQIEEYKISCQEESRQRLGAVRQLIEHPYFPPEWSSGEGTSADP